MKEIYIFHLIMTTINELQLVWMLLLSKKIYFWVESKIISDTYHICGSDTYHIWKDVVHDYMYVSDPQKECCSIGINSGAIRRNFKNQVFWHPITCHYCHILSLGGGTPRHPASLPRIPNVTQVAIMTTVITSRHFPLLKMTSATSLLGPQKQPRH